MALHKLWFGDLKFLIKTFKNLSLNFQSKSGGGGGGNTADDQVFEVSADMLKRVPPNFDIEATMRK